LWGLTALAGITKAEQSDQSENKEEKKLFISFDYLNLNIKQN